MLSAVRTIQPRTGAGRAFALSLVLAWQCASASDVADADFYETLPEGSLPSVPQATGDASATGALTPAPGQPQGALSGRIVFMSAGHGWTYNNSTKAWYTQRAVLNEMVEDYGNLDQMTLFADYCFDAGAVVVPFRPIGHQAREVVLDNDSPGVTFSEGWSDSASTVYYGNAGDIPYRFAAIAASETARATYTPNLPVTGFYPVYTWVRHGSDRTSQLYRILHTGGEALVRIPHHMVGNGWVYLGTYYFRAGSNATDGSVVISNLRPDPVVGSVVIADAIRFGNGMGDIIPEAGASRSGYPREEEASRYWIAASLGQGQPSSLYDTSSDDTTDNVGAPPRMAREMNRETTGTNTQRIFISFHSNSGGGRGVLGLYNDGALFAGTATPHQLRLAQLLGTEVNADLSALLAPPLEVRWSNRGANVTYARSDYAFGEIRNDSIGGEMDASIVEVAFHDSADDARLMRDPKVRNWVARASYQAVVRYMNEFNGAPLTFLPEPPASPRATVTAHDGVRISWSAPGSGGGSATGYRVYRSADGFGFGNPVIVNGATTDGVELADVPADTDVYFRVTAFNAGGESMPSETVGCRKSSTLGTPRVLFVNAFDRFDRFLSPRQTPTPGVYGAPGRSGTIDRTIPRLMNASDYVVQHGQALHANGAAFDSCQNESITNGQVRLADYRAAIWAAGRESTVDETFSAAEQAVIRTYAAAGGHLFVSGTEIGWDLDRASGPSDADRAFLHEVLHASLGSDAQDDAGTNRFAALAASVFAGRAAGTIDDGSYGIYNAPFPDILTPVGAGARASLGYAGSTLRAAAIQYDGSAGGGRVVFLGFPFETVVSPELRSDLMFDALAFFDALPPVRLAASAFDPAAASVQLSWTAVPGHRYEVQTRSSFAPGNWVAASPIVQATNAIATWTGTFTPGAGFYRVEWRAP